MATNNQTNAYVEISREAAELHAKNIQEAINWIIDAEEDYVSDKASIIFRIIKGLRDAIFDLSNTMKK